MMKDAESDFYHLYKRFAIGAMPKLAHVPGFLLRIPLRKRLAACDESTRRSLSLSMKQKDYRESVSQITVPVYYFYAVPGSLFSPELADWYRDHISAPFHAVPFQNSTHMLIADHPDLFAQEVLKIIDQPA